MHAAETHIREEALHHVQPLGAGRGKVHVDAKVLASASKHTALSHGHVEKTLRQIDLDIAELLAKSEQADVTPLRDGLTIEGEVARRWQCRATLLQSKAEIEARAHASCQA